MTDNIKTLVERLLLAGRHPDFAIAMEAAARIAELEKQIQFEAARGDYHASAGDEKHDALVDAHKRIAELEARSDLLKFIPTTADQMIEFIGPHFNSVGPVGDDGKLTGDLENVTFSLAVHDLLSAFEWSNLGPDEVAAAAGAQPECQACGDSITTHDPGICGNCFAMKYRDSSAAKDAERYRWLRDFDIRCKDGVNINPPCEHVHASMYSHAVGTIPAVRLVTGGELDRAIDSAIAAKENT